MIITIFGQWASRTTFHGWADLYLAKSTVSKCVWAVLMLLSWMAMSANLWQLLKHQGTDSAWTTAVYEDLELSERTGDYVHSAYVGNVIEFPYVTVCNFNRLRLSQMRAYNMTNMEAMALFSMTPVTYRNWFGPLLPPHVKAVRDWQVHALTSAHKRVHARADSTQFEHHASVPSNGSSMY
jgi:hypothetical protein